MAYPDYCVTAVDHDGSFDHEGEDNHTASSFMLWELVFKHGAPAYWEQLGEREAAYIVSLVSSGSKIVTGKVDTENSLIETGSEIEFTLRVSHNGRGIKLGDLPPIRRRRRRVVGYKNS